MTAPETTGLPSRAARGRPLLSVGVVTADLGRVNEQLAEVADAGAEMLHIDVMDGHFCPGLTVGPAFVSALDTAMRRDVHLLVEDPLDHIDAFADAGADLITVHLEATRHPQRALQRIAERGVARGLAITPSTLVAAVEPLLDDADLLLLVTVNPGYPRQSYPPSTATRVAAARELIRRRSDRAAPILIGVDGGITTDTAALAAATGADIIVAGRAVFDGSPHPARNLIQLLSALDAEPTGHHPARRDTR